MYDTLINLFQEYLVGWSWEEWQAAGSSDRDEIVVNALADFGPDMDVDEAYDLFYDWAAGLAPEDFAEPAIESYSTKTYEVSYREDGVKKRFTVQASSKAEAEQIAWSRVDADDIWVNEQD